MPDPIAPVDLASLAAGGGDPGARWRLDGEDLHANLVRLDRGDRIQPHRNDEVEVLVVVVAGRGELRGPRRTSLIAVRLRGGGEHGVVALSVPAVALQRHRGELPVGDPDAQRVAALVQLGLDP
jgi:hypothetical protein